MRVIYYIAIMVFSLLGFQVSGQQDAHFTQYFDNTLFVNPAYAGSRGLLNITGIHRQQWVGFDGHPESTTLGVHSPVVNENIGLGVTYVNDVVGPLTQNLVYGDFSYTLNFKNSPGKLAFGLKAGMNLLNSRTNELLTTDQQDPSLMTNATNAITPNFGFGIYYHSPKFFLGLSAPKLMEYNSKSNLVDNIVLDERRHYFLILGGVFNLSSDWKLRPTSNLKYIPGSPLSIDISAAFIYSECIWLGVMHRVSDSFGAFVQYQLTPQFKIGLAYDKSITELAGFNKGTYEALMSYDFTFKKKGIRSPRYF